MGKRTVRTVGEKRRGRVGRRQRMSVLGRVVEGCRVVECARQERGDGSLTQGLRGSGGVGRGRSDGGRKRAREAKEKSRRGETDGQIGVRERGRKADGERTRGEGEKQKGGLGVRERCRKAQGERTQGEGEGRTWKRSQLE